MRRAHLFVQKRRLAGYGEGARRHQAQVPGDDEARRVLLGQDIQEINKQQKLEARIAEGKCEEGHREGQEHLRREAQGEARA